MIAKQIPLLVPTVWGGEKLKDFKLVERSAMNEPLGETWEISTLAQGQSSNEDGVELKSVLGRELPYLVKLIDTNANLSLQVHPGNEYAQTHENSQGKDECWYILDAKEGAGIYLGLKKGVSKFDLKRSIENGENVNELLNFIPVRSGDFFNVTAGSVHAIGEGVTLAEVQQSSGVTYRIWDWNRLGLDGKPRELHIAKAMDVINFEQEKNQIDFFMYKNVEAKNEVLVTNEYFEAEVFYHPANESRNVELEGCSSILNLSGEVEISGIKLKKFESAILDQEKSIRVDTQIDSSYLIIREK